MMTQNLVHSLDDWGSDQSLEASLNSFLDHFNKTLEESEEAGLSRLVSNSTPTPEHLETSYQQPTLSSSNFSDQTRNTAGHSVVPGGVSRPVERPRQSPTSTAISARNGSSENNLPNNRPLSGANRPRGQYATSIDDMDKSNFFVDIARSRSDISQFADDELLFRGYSKEKKNNLENSSLQTDCLNKLPITVNGEGSGKVKKDENLSKLAGKEHVKLPLESGNKVLNLFFASSKKKNENVSKIELKSDDEKPQCGANIYDADVTKATNVKPNSSLDILLNMGTIFTPLFRDSSKKETLINGNEEELKSSYKGQIYSPLQSMQCEHPGSPNTLASTSAHVENSKTWNEKTKTRLENVSKPFKLPNIFETSTKVAPPTDSLRQTAPDVHRGVSSLILPSKENIKVVNQKNERKVQEFDLFEVLDWCVQWSGYPWNCYVAFAFAIAIYSSFLQLNPAVVILIVALVSAATFGVLLPKTSPSYQVTDI